ncbi:MAG: glycosyltransferase [Bacteroidota bacterium]
MSKKNKTIKDKAKSKVKSLSHRFQGKLSIVIPCYNERKSLPRLLKSLKSFEGKWANPLQLILVDDGSTDGTVKAIQDSFEGAFAGTTAFELIVLEENQGKGGALKTGVAKATGDQVLTMDADVATHPKELFNWLAQLPDKTFSDDQILIASRTHEDSKVKGDFIRRIAGLTFNFCIQLFTNLNLWDTQCGFKLYPAEVAKKLFGELQSTGWAHDVELLYNAKLHNIDIQPMPVEWANPGDSKISLLSDSIKMFFQSFATSTRLKFKHFVLDPIKAPFSTIKGTNDPALFRLLFATLAVVLLIVMPMLSFDYGISGDEDVQKIYGEKILSYFETDGEDDSALSYRNLYYYGGLFDYQAAWFNKYISWFDEYDTRHLLNSLVGFLLMLFTGLLARELSQSWKVAFFALLFMALSPRIFGHSMNNPKDIPFAAAYVFTLLHLIRFLKQLPSPGTKTVLMVIIGIAAAINVRVGGILLIAYFGLFTIMTVLLRPELRVQLSNTKFLIRMTSVGLFIVLASYFCGMLYWPYALQAPFSNPFTALSEMSNFSTSIRMLFQGEHLWSDEIAWYYIPLWIIISAPLFLLTGVLLFLVMCLTQLDRDKRLPVLFIAFTTIFPLAYAIYKGSSLYDGMRHFLFICPSLAVFSALGWKLLQDWQPGKVFGYASTAVLVALLAIPAFKMVKNHPYQYIYFNELIGGTDAAYGYYETDYWMNSMKGLCDWLIENDERFKKQETVTILTNCTVPVNHYIKKVNPNTSVNYIRYRNRNQKTGDYFLFFSRFVNKDLILSGAWPPKDVIYTEKVDDTVIGAVSRIDTKYDNEGFKAEKAGNLDEAIVQYTKELEVHPKNELALYSMANVKMQKGDFNGSRQALDRIFDLSQTYQNGWFMNGIFFFRQQKLAEAEQAFKRTIELNYKYSSAYYYLANIYAQQNRQQEALTALEGFDEQGGNIPNAYDMGIRIANSLNNQLLSAYFGAKKAYLAKDYQTSYNLVKKALGINSSYEPAKKLEEVYNKSLNNQKK